MFVVSLQIAIFFGQKIAEPQQLGNRINLQLDNMFDGNRAVLDLPPEMGDDIPLVQMSSTKSGNRLNVSRNRIDLFLNADPLPQTTINRFLNDNQELVYSYFKAVTSENIEITRIGMIVIAFDENDEAIKFISDKYFVDDLSNARELLFRTNLATNIGSIQINDILEVTSGHLTNDVLGLEKDGIIIKRDFNNMPNSGLSLSLKQLKEIWKQALRQFADKRIAEVK